MFTIRRLVNGCLLSLALFIATCGDDGQSEADRRGIGAQCARTEDCAEKGQSCLPFKGGYCGLPGCKSDLDCPAASACVRHTDTMTYCFRICVEKVDCNTHRSVDNEANCSSSATLVDGKKNSKVCLPPSSS